MTLKAKMFFGLMVVAICAFVLILTQKTDAKTEITFLLALGDGSANSDGVTVTWEVEEGKNVDKVYELHWKIQKWSDPQKADITKFGGKSVTLKLMTSPGPARNTGWDWIHIGEPKLVSNGVTVFDFRDKMKESKISMLIDGKKDEQDGIAFGATFDPSVGVAAGVSKPSIFMHPPWNGAVGNQIARWKIDVSTSVDAKSKLATTWGSLKAAR
jgi:hypothetical protein